MLMTLHRHTKCMLKMASVAALIMLLYIVMLFVSANLPPIITGFWIN